MYKKIALLGLLTIGLISGCSSNDKTSESQKLDDGEQAGHFHGIGYSDEMDSIFVATHEGLISTNDLGETWDTVSPNFDLMGFTMSKNGTMYTSGHPGPNSDLLNPLGVMKSTNFGEKWDSISLLGDIDFHILTSNYKNPDVLYGLNQMDTEKYLAGIFKSNDDGKTWETVEPKGLPTNLHDVYTLISLPNNENKLIAGTKQGIMVSEDSGKTWTTNDKNKIVTAINVLSDQQLIAYMINQGQANMVKSNDGGKTWESIELKLTEKDAVSYIAVSQEDTNIISVTTYKNSVYVTKDQGKTWEQILGKGIIQD